MYYTKWSFWSLRKRLPFSKSEQNAGISRRRNRFVEVSRNPVDTKKNPELFFLHFQFVRSMNFPPAVLLLHLDYEVNLHETYETMIYHRNVGVFCMYRFEQDVAGYGFFLAEIRSILQAHLKKS